MVFGARHTKILGLMKPVFVSTLLVLLSGCRAASAPRTPVGEAAFTKPTATEVFNLRTRCAELGEKILASNVIGSALAHEQTSHYDPKTNRCYVAIDVHMGDLNRYQEYYSVYLYDGQTGEMLASASSEKGAKSSTNSLGASDYDATIATINSFMADDRKQ